MIAKKFKNQKFDKEKSLKIKEIVLFGLVLVFFVLMFGFLIYSNIGLFKKNDKYQKRVDALVKEINILEGQNEKLRQGIINTEGDDYKEELIREQGYKKPGEQAVVILPPEKGGDSEDDEEKGFWQSIWDIIIFWN